MLLVFVAPVPAAPEPLLDAHPIASAPAATPTPRIGA